MRLTYYGALLMLLAACGSETAQSPAEIGPAEYIGSVVCADCHEAEFRNWQGSHHELAMQVANDSTVLGDFSAAEFDYYGETTQFNNNEDGFFVRTKNANGEDEDFRVAYAFGVTPLQQYLVEFPGGRMQALPYTWDSRSAEDGGQRWYHLYPDEYIAPDDELHWTGRLQNWNYMCAECHSTDLVMGYDLENNDYHTTYAELSVGCEACHGPASTHYNQAIEGEFSADLGLAVNLDDNRDVAWIINAETGIAERSEPHTGRSQQPESCGRCHSRRGVIATEYEYGKPLADTHRLALLDENMYFADGQIQEEVYVYGSFVQSRMYAAGVVCSDCHNPHSGELHTSSDSPNESSTICAQCHLPAKFSSIEHSRHKPGDASCIDCHMAARTYMGVDDRHDHSFRIPRPDLTLEIGAPNACANCHDELEINLAEYAPQTSPHVGQAIAAGRNGNANDELIDAIRNPNYPSIARATALTLLSPPLSDQAISTVGGMLADPDPLIRTAAVLALTLAPTEAQLDLGAHMLDDPILSVRLAAVSAFVDFRDLLPLTGARAFGPAAEEFRATNTMLANTPEALANLAGFELSMGDVSKASQYFDKALELVPQSALLRHSYGLALVRSGASDEALEQLRQAYELDPSYSRYAYVYGVALNSLGFSEKALEILQSARTQFPSDFDIGWAVATMLRDAGRLEAAQSVARELAAQYPDNANIAALQEALK